MKIITLFVFLLLSNYTFSQNVMYFQCEDEYCKNSNITIISLSSRYLTLYACRQAKFQVKDKIRSNPHFYEEGNGNYRGQGRVYEHCSELSTSARIVFHYYQSPSVFNKVGSHCYLALSKDNMSLIEWSEDDDGQSSHRYYSTRIQKEDLLPKAANYDFLNE